MSEVFVNLTKGQKVLVDPEDYKSLSEFHWQAQENRTKTGYYAVRNDGFSINGTRLKVKMHRQIMNCPDGYEVDHINGNTLDNRKSNLRICTHRENIQSQKSRGGKSSFRGITLHKNNLWRARITVNYKRIHLGLFKTELEAKLAHDQAREKFYV